MVSLSQRREPLDIEPLYITTRWKELHDLGPILVGLRGPSSLIEETCESVVKHSDASLLSSEAPLHTVAHHLRRLIAPPTIQGSPILLRLADPLVTRHWLGSYQGPHLDAILGPIDAWHVPINRHSWEPPTFLQWAVFERAAPAPEWQDKQALLGQLQLDALHQASRWRLMERLYHDLEQRHPRHLALIDKRQLTRWLDQRLNEALAWGLSSERSLAIWIEHSLGWGTDFIQNPDASYLQWLAHTPDALRLAPEQRLQQMDDGLPLEPDKETL